MELSESDVLSSHGHTCHFGSRIQSLNRHSYSRRRASCRRRRGSCRRRRASCRRGPNTELLNLDRGCLQRLLRLESKADSEARRLVGPSGPSRDQSKFLISNWVFKFAGWFTFRNLFTLGMGPYIFEVGLCPRLAIRPHPFCSKLKFI